MADGFKDRDEFLDALFDHIFEGDDDVEDDDQNWFNDRVASFFKEKEKENEGGSGGANAPRRRRPTSSGTGPRRRRRASAGSSSESGYGSKLFFG